jgi:hypothetical protein
MAPTLTASALEMASKSRGRDELIGLTNIARGFGVISIPFAIFGDFIKSQVYLIERYGSLRRSRKQKCTAKS